MTVVKRRLRKSAAFFAKNPQMARRTISFGGLSAADV